MKSKFYTLAGVRLRADSEREIADSRLYGAFYAPPGDCDVHICVTEGALPEPGGTLLSRGGQRTLYDDGGDVTLVSSYPQREGDKPFACRQGTGSRIDLIVDYPGGLWDAMLFHALNIPELLIKRGVFLLHCSYVLFRGEALLFCAGKGVGKSTQAALWEQYRGAEIVNGDRALLRLSDAGLTAFGSPYCGSSEIALNRSAPVKAVVLLEQGSNNKLSRCVGTQAFSRLMAQITYEPYQSEQTVDFALGVCERVPVYTMRCVPEKSAVSLLEESLWKQ